MIPGRLAKHICVLYNAIMSAKICMEMSGQKSTFHLSSINIQKIWEYAGDKTNMNIYSRNHNLILDDVPDFDIADILECGQCFHFACIGDHDYIVCAKGCVLHINQILDESGTSRIVLYDTTEEEYQKIWRDYFDMDTDYGSIKNRIVELDDRLAPAVQAKAGIRILHQDFFETLISFIISQNKQIPHIRQLVETLSKQYGTKVAGPDGSLGYLFPTVEQLYPVSEETLRGCKVGFRAPYIRDAVEKIYRGEIQEEALRQMSVSEARTTLMSIRGVGEKVANCVLLFGLGRAEVFPVDVWMKRIMEELYFHKSATKEEIERFAAEHFEEYAGYAQQYLFFYGRENGIGK